MSHLPEHGQADDCIEPIARINERCGTKYNRGTLPPLTHQLFIHCLQRLLILYRFILSDIPLSPISDSFAPPLLHTPYPSSSWGFYVHSSLLLCTARMASLMPTSDMEQSLWIPKSNMTCSPAAQRTILSISILKVYPVPNRHTIEYLSIYISQHAIIAQ